MGMLDWLRAKLIQFLSTSEKGQNSKAAADQKELGTFCGKDAYKHRAFEAKYNAATHLLKHRMNSKFPDSYHAKLGSSQNNAYDYGVGRAEAVDTASTAIAMALREGATVQQAADAGAASVGI